ncbi:hypothetical protein PMAYCL1PPCAC_07816, partial [Pristionchus mayeri]
GVARFAPSWWDISRGTHQVPCTMAIVTRHVVNASLNARLFNAMKTLLSSPVPVRQSRRGHMCDKSGPNLSGRPMVPQLAKEHKAEPIEYDYTTRDAIIYALGVGFNSKDDLRYVYEGAEGFMPVPTYIVAPGLHANNIHQWPGIEFDLTRLVHGDQYIEVYAPIPPEGSFRSEARVLDVLDKGSGALILTEITTFDKRT